MKHVRPRAVDFRGLRLSAEEGFVLSRVDGPLSLKELSNLTGIDEGRVGEIVGKLASQGAIDLDDAPPASRASSPGPTSAPSMRASSPSIAGRASSPSIGGVGPGIGAGGRASSPNLGANRASSPNLGAPPSASRIAAAAPAPTLTTPVEATDDLFPDLDAIPREGEASTHSNRPAAMASADLSAEAEAAAKISSEPPPDGDQLIEEGPVTIPPAEAVSSDALPEGEEGALAAERPSRPGDEEPLEDAVKDPGEARDESAAALDEVEAKIVDIEKKNEREWRKIYETIYHKMERDGRIAAARTVEGSHLMALCLDPEPQIVFSLLSNPKFGLEQARFLAFHHRTTAGLEMLARNAQLLADQMVQRRLLRNPQLPDTILRRIVHPKMLIDVYKIAIDREVPERSRVKTADLLRRKFTIASGDERAALVIKTEARVLILLTNCAFDANTTQILCGRTSWSMLAIQNLARWPATPPALLRHLLKQPVVRQNFGIRKLLLKHPNMPSDVKRAFMTGGH